MGVQRKNITMSKEEEYWEQKGYDDKCWGYRFGYEIVLMFYSLCCECVKV